MINWKVRFKQKSFWVAVGSAAIVFVHSMLNAFGVSFPVTESQVTSALMSILTILAAIGVITDHTTDGIGDSEQALSYEEPKKD